jgi:hypothetical protein
MRLGIAAVALLLTMLAPAPASAYIIVLKNGTYVDVGDTYRISGSNLEYRAPGGGTRVIPLFRIDFEGTEMMNGESIDEFVSRASKSLIRGGSPTTSTPASRTRPRRSEPPDTVTNATLEPYRIERERLDAEYRARNPQPAGDELATAAPRSAWRSRTTAPDYERWRAEAQSIQDQLDAERSQIGAIRDEIAYREANPFKYRLSYEYNYGRAPVIATPYGYYGTAGNPAGYLRADEEFAQLNSRLIDLEIQHKATLSRWASFVERARRAGVPPGIVYGY